MGQPAAPIDFARLESISQRRIDEWDLTSRQRLLAGWIVRLTFGRGRESIYVPNLDYFVRLTGIHKADVSRALGELQRAGVLNIVRPQRQPWKYTFLPNALLVEPDSVVDPADVMRCVEELEALNVLGPGFEPGGQRRLNIVTSDERVDGDLERASRELAIQKQEADSSPEVGERMERAGREPAGMGRAGSDTRMTEPFVSPQGDAWVRDMTMKSLLEAGTITREDVAIVNKSGSLGNAAETERRRNTNDEVRIGVSPTLERPKRPKTDGQDTNGEVTIGVSPTGIVNKSGPKAGITQARTRAPARAPAPGNVNVDVERKDITYDVDVGCQPQADADAGQSRRAAEVAYLMERLRQLIPAENFAKWERTWERRCWIAPHIIEEAIGDSKAYMHTHKVKEPGAVIFRWATQLIRERGLKIDLR